ncbi:MAG: serine/threonine-protein kinase [Myxococcota bacterium]
MKQPIYKPGTMIAGKYRIDKAIARGGCSIVYRGTHVGMERQVALKVMSFVDGRVDPAWQARFQREAKLASQLSHPYTITTYDYGEYQGIFYIIMEWVEGLSLRNLIKEYGAIEPRRSAMLIIKILKSLSEAHRQQILHRDMKPSNIMVTEDLDGSETIKVLDFGLAKAQQPEDIKLTRDGDFIGTPRYASPEQLTGHELPAAADLYGVGAVMWEMLMGEPAVPAVDYGTCVHYHLGPHVWKLPPGSAPDELALIVERALSKDVSGRYQSCEEMLEPIKAWLYESSEYSEAIADLGEDDLLGEEHSEPRNVPDAIGGLEGLAPLDIVGLSKRREAPRRRVSSNEQARVSLRRREPSLENLFKPEELELDEQAMRSTPVDPMPKVAPRPESMPVRPLASTSRRLPSSRRGNNTWSLMGVFLLALGMFGAGGWWLSQNHTSVKNPVFVEEPQTAGDRLLDDIAKGRAMTSGAQDHSTPLPFGPKKSTGEGADKTIPASRILMWAKDSGWKYNSGVDVEELEDLVQTNVQLKHGKRRHKVDVTLFECENISLAEELELATKMPANVVRMGRTVLRMSPTSSSRTGVDKLTDELLSLKRSN